MSTCLLGIDFGTGGAKACITDSELNILAYAYRSYEIITKSPGWSEHDAGEYYKVTCELIRECISRSRIDASEILSLAVSCAMPSAVFLDKNGEPVCNAFNLMDKRAVREIEELKEQFGENFLFSMTANRLDDQPVLVSLLWIRKHQPEVYEEINKVMTVGAYIKYRLTGIADSCYSDGPLYGIAYDMMSHRFDAKLLEQIEVDPRCLPQISPCERIIGQVSVKAASETGLKAGTLVASGQADCNAGWIGGGAIHTGDIQMNLGTCGNFGVIHQNTDFLDSMINIPYTTNSENTYVVIPTTTTGGQLLRYAKEQFSELEIAAEKVSGIDAFDLLNMEAESVPAGSEGLIMLPYLMGERTPLWDNYARGVLFGMSLNHGKAHMVRAMMESVAYALYSSFEIIVKHYSGLNFPIVLNEGGAKSKLWRRIITDVFDVPTVMLKNRAGAPYGDCVLAGKAAGIFPDYQIAAERAEKVDLMEPDKKMHELYMDYYQLYKKLYQDLKADFVSLYNIRNRWENQPVGRRIREKESIKNDL